jgi:hypothetical protein
MFHHHPNRALAHLRRISCSLRLVYHGSNLSRKGASGKPGAVHGMVLGGLEFSTVRNSTVKNGCDNSIKSALGHKQTLSFA